MVAELCAAYGIPHRILPVRLARGNLHDKARAARYAAMAKWMQERGLAALATAHHADDQAETFLMRLNRGSGVPGLAGVRARGTVPGTQLALLRPLLGWRREELAGIVARSGLEPAQDPSNDDPKYDRARIREALKTADWSDENRNRCCLASRGPRSRPESHACARSIHDGRRVAMCGCSRGSRRRHRRALKPASGSGGGSASTRARACSIAA